MTTHDRVLPARFEAPDLLTGKMRAWDEPEAVWRWFAGYLLYEAAGWFKHDGKHPGMHIHPEVLARIRQRLTERGQSPTQALESLSDAECRALVDWMNEMVEVLPDDGYVREHRKREAERRERWRRQATRKAKR